MVTMDRVELYNGRFWNWLENVFLELSRVVLDNIQELSRVVFKNYPELY
jgi:hypothetical protein